MRGSRPRSAYVCTITPFGADGALDDAGLTELAHRLSDAGVGAYLGSSSPGEGYALSLAEVERMYGIVADAVAGRVPVRAMGVEPHTANELRPLVRLAESTGVEAMQLYSVDAGHANKLTPGELERYYRSLLDEMTIPAVLSSHVFNGLLPLDLIARLLDAYPDVVIGVNCTTPEVSYLHRLIELVDGRADVHVGGPMHAVTAFALGAQGFLCTEGNLAPQLCRAVIDAVDAGDAAATAGRFRDLIALHSLNMWPGGSMRFLKTAMRLLGQAGWHLRPPFEPLGDDDAAFVRAGLDALALPEWALVA
jgi:4-hydroxy-tetrahydrodipicolinate synthase